MFLGKHTCFSKTQFLAVLKISPHRECGEGWQLQISFDHFQML